jgi:hypothetical protein
VVVGCAGFADVGFNEETILGDVELTSGEAVEDFDVAAAAATEFEGAGLVHVAVLRENDAEIEERLEAGLFHGDGDGGFGDGDVSFQ